jgi:hypothetical protein
MLTGRQPEMLSHLRLPNSTRNIAGGGKGNLDVAPLRRTLCFGKRFPWQRYYHNFPKMIQKKSLPNAFLFEWVPPA